MTMSVTIHATGGDTLSKIEYLEGEVSHWLSARFRNKVYTGNDLTIDVPVCDLTIFFDSKEHCRSFIKDLAKAVGMICTIKE